MVDLINTTDMVSSIATSGGAQEKWRRGDIWIKKDLYGYEGLAEAISSRIAEHTNIGDLTKYKVSTFYTENLYTTPFKGCESQNFLNKEEEIFTFHRILQKATNFEEFVRKFNQRTTEDRIKMVVDIITNITNIQDFDRWFSKLLEFDYLILNKDRHFNNLAIIKTPQEYKPMPLFDNGLSFLSDYGPIYNIKEEWEQISKIKAQPFGISFDEQLEAVEKTLGLHLKFEPFEITFTDLELQLYENYEIDRIKYILENRIYKHHSLQSTQPINNDLSWD